MGSLKLLFAGKYISFVLLLLIVISNNWIYQIVKQDIFIAFILITITIVLFALTLPKISVIYKSILIITVSFLVLLTTWTLRESFDKSINTMNPIETANFFNRHAYFVEGLGYLYANSYSQQMYTNLYTPTTHLLRNVSYAIDPNLYFFRSHPREKAGIDEFDKYPFLLLPFFVLGLLYYFVSLDKYKVLTIYLVVSILITGFLSPYYKLGPVLLFPFLNIVLLFGVLRSINLITNDKI